MKRHWNYLIWTGLSLVIFAIFLQSPTTLAAASQVASTPTPAANTANQIRWNPPGELSFDVKNEHFFKDFDWFQDRLEDGSIILSNSTRVIQEYNSLRKVTLSAGNEQIYFIVKADSVEPETQLIQLAIKKFFDKVQKITFEEPDATFFYYIGHVLTRVEAFVTNSSAIQIREQDGSLRNALSVVGSGIRLQDGTYGIVIGLEAGTTTTRLAITLSSTNIPLPPQNILMEKVRALEVVPIHKATNVMGITQQVSLDEIFHTSNLVSLNYSFAFPKTWVVTYDASLYKETVYVGTSHSAIQALQRSQPIPDGEIAGTVELYMDGPFPIEEDKSLPEDYLDFRLSVYRAIRQNSSVDAIYADQGLDQQPVAYATFIQQIHNSHIVTIERTRSHGYVELFTAKGSTRTDSLNIALAIAQSIQPISLIPKDSVVLNAQSTFYDTAFAAFQEYSFHFPGNWQLGPSMPHFGAIIELPVMNRSTQKQDVVTIMFTGVPLMTPAGLINMFDSVDLGLQDINPPQGFLLEDRHVVAAAGSYKLGGELLMILVNVGVDSSWNREYVSVKIATPEGVAVEEFVDTALAIAKSIRKMNDPEPTSAVTNSASQVTNKQDMKWASEILLTTSPTPTTSSLLTIDAMPVATATLVSLANQFGLDPNNIYINPIDQAVYIRIPAGNFTMGGDDSNALKSEKPAHTVWLDPFWIMHTEVTYGQYAKCVAANHCSAFSATDSRWSDSRYADHPANPISWYQAKDYAEWVGGRLPTEAEWEKAACGTDGRIYPWGNQEPDSTLLNFDDNIMGTTPVGHYPLGKSPYGLVDMAGNVWEWTNSIPRAYPYRADDGREDPKPTEKRIIRGGSLYNAGYQVRCSYRMIDNPILRWDFYGFRVVMDKVPEK